MPNSVVEQQKMNYWNSVVTKNPGFASFTDEQKAQLWQRFQTNFSPYQASQAKWNKIIQQPQWSLFTPKQQKTLATRYWTKPLGNPPEVAAYPQTFMGGIKESGRRLIDIPVEAVKNLGETIRNIYQYPYYNNPAEYNGEYYPIIAGERSPVPVPRPPSVSIFPVMDSITEALQKQLPPAESFITKTPRGAVASTVLGLGLEGYKGFKDWVVPLAGFKFDPMFNVAWKGLIEEPIRATYQKTKAYWGNLGAIKAEEKARAMQQAEEMASQQQANAKVLVDQIKRNKEIQGIVKRGGVPKVQEVPYTWDSIGVSPTPQAPPVYPMNTITYPNRYEYGNPTVTFPR